MGLGAVDSGRCSGGRLAIKETESRAIDSELIALAYYGTRKALEKTLRAVP